MTSRYTRQIFDDEVRSFATETRKKTRKTVERIGWAIMVSNDQTWLEVSILNHEGRLLTRNVAI